MILTRGMVMILQVTLGCRMNVSGFEKRFGKGVSLREARKVVGPDIALLGNVNCGLLQTGTDEECRQDILRSLAEGMEDKRGFIFCTSNTVYTGMPLERYELMNELWRKHGNYDAVF